MVARALPADAPVTLAELQSRFSHFGVVRSWLVSSKRRWLWRVTLFTTRAAKRAMDVAGALAIGLLALPVCLVIAACIKCTDGGPILFWQTRVGRWGREFSFPKFRSMVQDAEAKKAALAGSNQHGQEGITFKMKRDPRVTWIGRIIRRFSLDELPQIWCVLKGDMSLVGPRPPVPQEVARYSLSDRRRLDATPGLTCLWQVSGRAEIPFDQQVDLDVKYIHQQGFWYDVRLLLRTIPAVLSGRGAY